MEKDEASDSIVKEEKNMKNRIMRVLKEGGGYSGGAIVSFDESVIPIKKGIFDKLFNRSFVCELCGEEDEIENLREHKKFIMSPTSTGSDITHRRRFHPDCVKRSHTLDEELRQKLIAFAENYIEVTETDEKKRKEAIEKVTSLGGKNEDEYHHKSKEAQLDRCGNHCSTHI